MAEAAPNSDANASAAPADPAGGDFSVSMPESWRATLSERTGPAGRIALIEDSQRCLAYGWLSLVPVVGAFFVVPAVRLFRRVDHQHSEWNPARHLWLRGLALASFGFWVSLLWWGLGLQWVVNEPHRQDTIEGITLAYLMLFGSIPTLLGLAVAAIRWPNAIGAFVLRRRWMLTGLTGVGYLIALQWLALAEWRHNQEMPEARWSPDPQPLFSVYWAMAVWLVWVIGGFLTLSFRAIKSPGWWSVWLAGTAVLTSWVTAN